MSDDLKSNVLLREVNDTQAAMSNAYGDLFNAPSPEMMGPFIDAYVNYERAFWQYREYCGLDRDMTPAQESESDG